MQISNQTAAGFGIFCDIAGTISDLNVSNYNFSGFPEVRNSNFRNFGLFAGTIAGISNFGEPYILNCSTKGEFYDSITYSNSHNYRTGIIGAVNRSLTVYRCSADVKLESKSTGVPCVGAIVGVAPVGSGTIKIYDCVGNVNANITLSNSNNCYHAGIPCIWTTLNTIMDNIIGTINVKTSLHNAGGVLGFENGANFITASNCYLKGTETYNDGSKANMYAVHSDGVSPNSSMFTNVNVVKDQSSFQNMYGSIQRPYAGNNQLSSDNELVTKAKTDLGNSPIFDIEKIENFGAFNIENNPVINNLHTIIPKHYNVEYNGQPFKVEDYINVPQQYYTVDYDDTQNYTDAGKHTFTVNLSKDAHDLYVYIEGTDAFTATFDVEITPAPISISQLQVDEFGKLTGLTDGQSVSEFLLKALSSGTIYSRDTISNGKAPEMVLQYRKASGSWSETLPTTAGSWYVRAYLKNSTTSNYVLENDGQTAFNRAKDYVSVPYFFNDDSNTSVVGTTTTVNYSGTNQVLSLINDATSKTLTGISVGDRSSGFLYAPLTGEFSATGVGTYTVEVSLADTTNTQWADKSTDAKKTITLVVKPAELVVTIDDASKTSWSKGERDFKILIYVDGIIDNDAVKIDASYGLVGGTDVNYVAENNKVVDTNTGRMTITVDTTNLSINKKYYLNIALKDGVAANKNYVLKNDAGDWEFLLTTSKIKQEDLNVVWEYSNIIAGSANFDNLTSGSVPYNESEYTIGLNTTLLPEGVEITYSGVAKATNSVNSKVNTITAVLKPKDGYSFDADVKNTTFTFNWTITPVECDLSTLVWLQDFEYNGKNQTMSILNLPSWLSNQNYSGNIGKNADSYTAVYTAYLTQYGNHTFTNRANSSEVVIAVDGRSATITHEWNINKAIIQVSNSADLWLVETITNNDGEPVDLRIPIAMDKFGGQLILNYYTDAGCTNLIDPKDIKLVKEPDGITTTPTPYYAKVELDSSYADNYELVNVTNSTAKDAVLRFNVGGRREIIHLTVDTSLIYNGNAQTVKIESDSEDYNNLVEVNKAGYTVKYYAVIDDAGNYGPIDTNNPTDDTTPPTFVGRYVAVIFVSDLDGDDENKIVDEYIVYCHPHYFEITQLQLSTNWTYTANGVTAIPNENVTANNTSVNVSDFYNYEIYDGTGTNVVGTKDSFSLAYNTRYIARLSVKDTTTNSNGLANVVIVDPRDNVAFTNTTEYAFTTGSDPDSVSVVLDNPEIDGLASIVYDKNPHAVEIKIKDQLTSTYITGSNLLNYVTISLKPISSTSSFDASDIFTQTNAGTYTYVVSLKPGANATWLWDDGSDSKEVTYTIDKKPILAPSFVTEYEWTGRDINIWTTDTTWQDWVIVDGTYSATEISNDYSATFNLIDPLNTYWDDQKLIDDGKEIDEIVVNWAITKVKIFGEWTLNNKGYYEFVTSNEDLAENSFEVKYKDASGNEVSPNNFVEGQKYSAFASVTDSDHFEFVDEDVAYQILKKDFEYNKPVKPVNKFIEFLKANWWWLLIILVAIILLIILIIILVKRKKKKEEENLMKDPNNPENYGVPPYQNQNMGQVPPYGMPPYYQQPMMQQPYMQPQYPQPQMSPQYQQNPQGNMNMYDMKQDSEIQELKQQIKELAKDSLATNEEKKESKDLEKVEDMLKQFILSNFDDNPVWVPFTKQDMVDYPIESLMALYSKAKKIANEKVAAPSSEPQTKAEKLNLDEYEKMLAAEAADLERKVEEYQKLKHDSGYDKLLCEVREKIGQVDEAKKQMEDRQRELDELNEKLKNNSAETSSDKNSQKKTKLG